MECGDFVEVMSKSNSAMSSLQQTFEQLIDEREYLLEFHDYIKDLFQALNEEVAALSKRKLTKCEESASIEDVSTSPVSEYVQEEVTETVEESLPSETVQVIEPEKKKTKYEILVDKIFNREQNNVLARAKRTLKRLNDKVEEKRKAMAALKADMRKYDTTKAGFQQRKGGLLSNINNTQNEIGIYKERLSTYENENFRLAETYKLKQQELQLLKTHLRRQKRVKVNFTRDIFRRSKLMNLLAKEIRRQDEDMAFFAIQRDRLESTISDLKQNVNEEANFLVFSKYTQGTKYCSQIFAKNKRPIRNSFTQSPDACLKVFKAEQNRKRGHMPVSSALVKSQVPQVTNYVLKQKEKTNILPQLREKHMEQEQMKQTALASHLLKQEALMKTKYFQLEKEVQYLTRYRTSWQGKETDLKKEVEASIKNASNFKTSLILKPDFKVL